LSGTKRKSWLEAVDSQLNLVQFTGGNLKLNVLAKASPTGLRVTVTDRSISAFDFAIHLVRTSVSVAPTKLFPSLALPTVYPVWVRLFYLGESHRQS